LSRDQNKLVRPLLILVKQDPIGDEPVTLSQAR